MAHEVTFRVQMPDPNMEAVVEVNGAVFEMEAGIWGAREATVTLEEAGECSFRFGTPAGVMGLAWERS